MRTLFPRSAFASRFSSRASRVSANALARVSQDLSPSVRGALRGSALIAAALLLGASAHRLSAAYSLEQWKSAHPPERALWQAMFQGLGMRELRDSTLRGKIIRHLPATLDSALSVWSSEEGSWIALFPERASSEPILFCSHCEPMEAANWSPLGSSWEAFERVSKLQPTRPRRAPRLAQEGDPREIHY